MILAIWDAQIRAAQGELAGTDLEAGIEEATNDYRWYPTLDTVAPAVFCVNSWIDLRWACVVQRRQKYKRTLAQRWDAEWAETSAITTTTSTTTVAARTRTLTTTAEAAITTPTSPYYAARDSHQDFIMVVDDEDDFYSSSWWHHCRKHAAHRRTLWAALTFGGAALLALLAVILTRTGSAMNSTQLELASAHLYVASAVICLTGKRTRPWFQSTITKTSDFLSGSDGGVIHDPAQSHHRHWLGQLTYPWRNPELLEDMGDALFLIGSLLDAMLVDFDATAIEESAAMGIVASGLWLLDALLYMHSDFVRARQGSTRVERLGREIGSHDDDPPACFV